MVTSLFIFYFLFFRLCLFVSYMCCTPLIHKPLAVHRKVRAAKSGDVFGLPNLISEHRLDTSFVEIGSVCTEKSLEDIFPAFFSEPTCTDVSYLQLTPQLPNILGVEAPVFGSSSSSSSNNVGRRRLNIYLYTPFRDSSRRKKNNRHSKSSVYTHSEAVTCTARYHYIPHIQALRSSNSSEIQVATEKRKIWGEGEGEGGRRPNTWTRMGTGSRRDWMHTSTKSPFGSDPLLQWRPTMHDIIQSDLVQHQHIRRYEVTSRESDIYRERQRGKQTEREKEREREVSLPPPACQNNSSAAVQDTHASILSSHRGNEWMNPRNYSPFLCYFPFIFLI